MHKLNNLNLKSIESRNDFNDILNKTNIQDFIELIEKIIESKLDDCYIIDTIKIFNKKNSCDNLFFLTNLFYTTTLKHVILSNNIELFKLILNKYISNPFQFNKINISEEIISLDKIDFYIVFLDYLKNNNFNNFNQLMSENLFKMFTKDDNLELIKKLLSYSISINKNEKQFFFLNLIKSKSINIFKFFSENNFIDFSYKYNIYIYCAVNENLTDFAVFILEQPNTKLSHKNSSLILEAIKSKNIEIVKALYNHKDYLSIIKNSEINNLVNSFFISLKLINF